MNRLLTLTMLALLLLACKKDKANDPTPAQLPPATQHGANIFACYVNGKPFIQERRTGAPNVGTQLTANSLTGKYYLSVDASMRKVDTLFPYTIYVKFEFPPATSKKYDTNDLKNNIWWGGGRTENPRDKIFTSPDHDDTGWLKIDRLDTLNRIIAGRFEFTATDPELGTYNITDGRFDCHYTY